MLKSKAFRKIVFFKDRRGESPIWLTIYGDMMTNLMLFFLMLYALSRIEKNQRDAAYDSFKEDYSSPTQQQAQPQGRGAARVKMDSVDDKVKQFIAERQAGEFADVDIDEKKIKLKLNAPVLFDSCSSTLKPQGKTVLNDIADIIKDLPNPVIIEGHTDSDPILGQSRFTSNWHLSIERSISVINYLVGAYNLNAARFASSGYGDVQPIAPNDSSEHKALNRRIEINIIKTE